VAPAAGEQHSAALVVEVAEAVGGPVFAVRLLAPVAGLVTPYAGSPAPRSTRLRPCWHAARAWAHRSLRTSCCCARAGGRRRAGRHQSSDVRTRVMGDRVTSPYCQRIAVYRWLASSARTEEPLRPKAQVARVQQAVLVSVPPSKSQLIATSSSLEARRGAHMNDLSMSGHLVLVGGDEVVREWLANRGARGRARVCCDDLDPIPPVLAALIEPGHDAAFLAAAGNPPQPSFAASEVDEVRLKPSKATCPRDGSSRTFSRRFCTTTTSAVKAGCAGVPVLSSRMCPCTDAQASAPCSNPTRGRRALRSVIPMGVTDKEAAYWFTSTRATAKSARVPIPTQSSWVSCHATR